LTLKSNIAHRASRLTVEVDDAQIFTPKTVTDPALGWMLIAL
jgi:hypothetical protein